MEQTVSAKELRQELPRIMKALKKGRSFTLIYRSKPIAELTPYQPSSNKKGLWELMESGKFNFSHKKSAVELIRSIRD